MAIQRFRVVLDAAKFDDDDIETIHAALDDASLSSSGGVWTIAVDRETESFVEAVSSALRDIGRSGIAARIARIEPDDPADQADADEINRIIAALGRFERSDVQAWPVGRVASTVRS
ncbi:MAG: hypothetical protein WD069_01870 [Planctomycetales bacterium]